MSDYSLVGAFNTGGAASLNGDLINKLREAEENAKVAPIDTQLENWDVELETITEIEGKVAELLTAVKQFDLFNSSGNVFDQITASTTGDSAIFDAVDVSSLSSGTTTIDVTQLAQRDVYQSDTFSDADAVMTVGQNAGDKLSVQIGSEAAIDFETAGKTYQELADEINATDGLTASVEQVGDSDYRIIIKSTDFGLENALTITQTDASDVALASTLGYDDPLNHTLTAQNLEAQVDGVDYNVSSNTITIQGNLAITAVDEGESTISIQEDSGSIVPALEELVTAYNAVIDAIDGELLNAESAIEDTSSLRSILTNIKDKFFGEYGSDDKSIFNYGFELDKTGHLSIDTTVLSERIADEGTDGLKDLFIGVAEDKGLGTQLKELIDDMNAYDGLISMYGDNMAERKTTLEEEREKAIETLDAKYDLMASQFSAYAGIIAQMEASFGGLSMMIEQSTARS